MKVMTTENVMLHLHVEKPSCLLLFLLFVVAFTIWINFFKVATTAQSLLKGFITK